MLEQCLQEMNGSDLHATAESCGEDVAVYTFRCHKPLLVTPQGKGGMEILFCREGVLRLAGAGGQDVDFSGQEILLFYSRLPVQRLQFSSGFRGILVASGSSDSSKNQESPEGDLHAAETVLSQCGGVGTLTRGVWRQSFFTVLSSLPAKDKKQYAALKARELLYLLARRQLSVTPPMAYFDHHQVEVVQKVRAYMAENMGEPLTITQLAAQHHISQTALKTCFRALYGVPVHACLREIRMERAAQLLSATRLPVLQIASEVGYSSVSQFGQAFRSTMGLSPSQYRRQGK